MNAYDQIIFDELVQHRPVHLNEVGYLKVETYPARIKDGRSISAPRNVVAFTSEPTENARNIVDILIEKGTDHQTAWNEYGEWLARSRKDDKLIIDGAGTVNNCIFIPTPELDKALNPNSPGTVAVKPRSKAWIWILIGIIVLGAIFFIGMHYCENEDGIWKCKKPAQTTTLSTTTMPEQPAADSTTANSSAGESKVANDTVNISAALPLSELGFPVEGRHYVVGGVFDIPENADIYVNFIKRNFPELKPEKFSYPGTRTGRIMVTVYSSDKRSEVLDIRRQLAWSYDLHDYWLFPEEK